MTKAKRCHDCGGSLLYMPAGYVNGFAYCAACGIKRDEALASQIAFDRVQDVRHGREPYENLIPILGISEIENMRKDRATKGEKTMTKYDGQYKGEFHTAEEDKQSTSDNRPKYKVGDRVKFGWGKLGTVTSVSTRHIYDLQEVGNTTMTGGFTRDESFLTDAPFTEDEAWTKATIMLAQAVLTNQAIFSTPLPESVNRALRHDAYVVLGGAHVKITDEIKARVRAIIAQAAA